MPTRVFLSYSHKDEALREELAAQLEILVANKTLETWHARKIEPGRNWRAVSHREIDAADVVLLLVSADFLASDYCRDTEVRRAIERHEASKARVVPVVLRPCLWDEAPFKHLAPLPANGTPVTLRPNRDEAWLEVARGIREIARSGLPSAAVRPPDASVVAGAVSTAGDTLVSVAPAVAGDTAVSVAPAVAGDTAVSAAPAVTGELPVSVAGSTAAMPAASPGGAEPSRGPSAPPRPEVERWLRELEAAHAEKGNLVGDAPGLARIQTRIDELKRKLREGGQLQQGDSLGDGRYYLLRPLGRGGFATVWEADDREAGKRVAIKVLHPQLANDPTRRERFFRGARAMARIVHPGVVRVLVPYEEDAGFFYFVMELIQGGDLHRAVLAKHLDRSRVVPMILQAGEALAAAHREGFVHRDVSPHNLLIGDDGTAKLTDFDLVSAAESTGGTRTGAMGKFLYAAPEVMTRPQDADARADVFGLGMTAIFCLHGAELPTNVLRKPEQLLARLDCGPLAPVLQKAIDWEVAERYASIDAFCGAVRAVFEDRLIGREATLAAGVAVLTTDTPGVASSLEDPEPVTPEASSSLRGVSEPVKKPRRARSSTAALVVAAIVILGATAAAVRYWPQKVGPMASSEQSDASAMDTPDAVEAVSATPRGSAAAPPVSYCPPEMAFLPASTFRMGSDATDKDADADECPAHDVTLSAFCFDKVEVSVAKYKLCAREARNGVTCPPVPTTVQWKGADVKLWSQFCNGGRADRDDHPINCVPWTAAEAFCRWSGGALPTEAQWEYAARGKERRRYPWGDEPPPAATLLNACGGECLAVSSDDGTALGNRPVMYAGRDGFDTTAPIKSYAAGATPDGVFDLAGNVSEWVQDMRGPYNTSPAIDPIQTNGTSPVLRGGGWSELDRKRVRGAARSRFVAGDRGVGIGFRCARTPSP